VRLAWVGLELPLTPGRAGRQLAMTSGVVSAPRGWWQRIAALFLGRYGVQTGYAVNARDAVNLLQAKDPTAAAWWREHCGHMLDGKRWFLFPTAGGEARPCRAGPLLTAMRTPVSLRVGPAAGSSRRRRAAADSRSLLRRWTAARGVDGAA